MQEGVRPHRKSGRTTIRPLRVTNARQWLCASLGAWSDDPVFVGVDDGLSA
jgi:hypothetical protein